MTYNPAQPRVPAGVPEGGEWTKGTFFHDASQWTHPGSGQKRIYLNNHDAGFGNKVWIEESGDTYGTDWRGNIKQTSYGGTSPASIRAGSNRPMDVAGEASHAIVAKHGINPRAAKFSDLWKMARPEKISRTAFETLDPKVKAKFMSSGGRLFD